MCLDFWSRATVLLGMVLCVVVGCSKTDTVHGNSLTADVERAIEAEQKSAEEAEMARQKAGEK